MKTTIIVLALSLGVLFNMFSQKLVYATYLGGNIYDGDWLTNFSIDTSGTAYFASTTYYSGFPVTNNAYDKTYNNNIDNYSQEDIVIVGFNMEQNSLKYSSYFGGNSMDLPMNTLYRNNRFFIVGNTSSSNFPITANAFDTSYNGPKYTDSRFRHAEGYFACFDSNKLSYSTFIGTSGTMESMNDVLINVNGEIVVFGTVDKWDELSINHQFSTEKFDSTGNAIIIRFNARGDSVLSKTLLGPNFMYGMSATSDAQGNIYLTSNTTSKNFPVTPEAYDTSFNGGTNDFEGDIFVTKLTPACDSILFSTYLGGSDNDGFPSICLDASNNIIVYGLTRSKDFPITKDAIDTSFDGETELFITKLSSDGKQLLYSSFLGGNETNTDYGEFCNSLIAADNGDIYLCGRTDALNHPVTLNAIQSTNNGASDIFITVLDSTLKYMKFSTYFGGKLYDECKINIDKEDNIIGAGYSRSSDLLIPKVTYDSTISGQADLLFFKISLTDTMVKTEGISLNKDTLITNPHDHDTLYATVSPENADFKKITWNSSNTSVATVNAKGIVTSNKVGDAIITATTLEGKHTDTCFVSIKEATAIQESNSLPCKIFPNPSKGHSTLSLDKSQNREALVEIYNLQGTQVFSKTFHNTPSATIDLTGYQAGIYVVKVIADGVCFKEKIVKE